MTWKINGLSALLAGLALAAMLWIARWNKPTPNPAMASYPVRSFTAAELEEARQFVESYKQLHHGEGTSRRVGDAFGQRPPPEAREDHRTHCPGPGSFRERVNINEFGSFAQFSKPSFAEGVAGYQAKIAQENPQRILRPENLINTEQRASSRRSIARLKEYLMEYWVFRLNNFQDAERQYNLGADGSIWTRWLRQGFDQTIKFHNLQFLLALQELDEMERILDLVEKANVKVEGDQLLFETQPQQADYIRMSSRLARLEKLRNHRQSLWQDLERQLSPPSTMTFASTATAKWDFLIYSGASVDIDNERITINHKTFNLPIDMAKLVAAYGPEHREFAGDATQFVWDELGFAAVCGQGTRTVNKLVIALRAREDRPWPRKVVRGRLTVLGVAVDENTTPWSFNRESPARTFSAIDDVGRDWVLNLQNCKVRTEFKLDGSIDSLIVEPR